MTAFNEVYYRTNKEGSRVVNLESYFYQLDAIADWNRMYGSRGFLQYQFVLPKPASFSGISTVLRRITEHEAGCLLAVLKLFGPQQGLMSFPMEGYTLALDFPVNSRTLALLPELDAVVADHNGRLYLAKDARARAEMLARGYPALAKFATIRDRVDPTHRFASLQSERLGL